jgi:hypothetical protein
MANATEGPAMVGFRARRAWAGVLVGPTAWIVQLFGNWILGEVIACAPANAATGQILGRSLDMVVVAFDVVLLALTVLSGIGSFLELRRIRSASDPTPAGWASWLASAGVMTSVLFSILIVTSFIPLGLIRRCA